MFNRDFFKLKKALMTGEKIMTKKNFLRRRIIVIAINNAVIQTVLILQLIFYSPINFIYHRIIIHNPFKNVG